MLQRLSREKQVLIPYVVLIVAIIINAWMQNNFFQGSNLIQLIYTALPLMVASTSQTLVILTGGIDLSTGALMGLVNVIVATTPQLGLVSPLLGLLAGAVCGLIVGVLVGMVRLPSVVITLAIASVETGVALYILPNPGGSVTGSVSALGTPVAIILITILLLGFWWVVRHSRFGASLYAVGANEQSAYVSGVNTLVIELGVYVVAGILTAVAGIILSATAMSGDPLIANSYTLTSIAAVVFGGTALLGGAGGALGSIVSALILTIISGIIFYSGVSSFYQGILQGAILIFSLGIGSMLARKNHQKGGAGL